VNSGHITKASPDEKRMGRGGTLFKKGREKKTEAGGVEISFRKTENSGDRAFYQ